MSYPSYDMTIPQLVKTAFGDSCVNGWWDEESPNYAEKLALIHSEVSEALEDLRDPILGSDLTFWETDEKGKPIGFPTELADVVIRVADLCGHLGIDLEKMISVKLEYNRQRGFKHGGKKF